MFSSETWIKTLGCLAVVCSISVSGMTKVVLWFLEQIKDECKTREDTMAETWCDQDILP